MIQGLLGLDPRWNPHRQRTALFEEAFSHTIQYMPR